MVDTEAVRVKIILLGDSGVGKSSLIRRFVEDHFLPDEPATIGHDFKPFTMEIDGEVVQFNIWDTAGAERYSGYLTPSFYRGTNGALFLYDVTSRKTLSGIEYWLDQSEQFIHQPLMKMLVGTKIDLSDREVNKREGSDFARKNGMIFVETSAKTNENVQDAFIELARKILQDQEFRALHPIKGVPLQPAASVQDEAEPGACAC